MITTNFLLTDLNCDACGKISKMKLGKISGVKTVHITQTGNEAQGQLESDREITIDELQQALAGTGYKVQAA